jgi:hypothetical protein
MGGILIDEIEPIGGSECDQIDLPSKDSWRTKFGKSQSIAICSIETSDEWSMRRKIRSQRASIQES